MFSVLLALVKEMDKADRENEIDLRSVPQS